MMFKQGSGSKAPQDCKLSYSLQSRPVTRCSLGPVPAEVRNKTGGFPTMNIVSINRSFITFEMTAEQHSHDLAMPNVKRDS